MMTPSARPRAPQLWRIAALVLALLVGALALPADAAEVLSSQRSTVTVEVNKGAVVTLPRAASTLFVANPEVADIQMKSPRLIYLMGKRPGDTTLFAVDEREQVFANIDVSVTHNLSRLKDAIRSLHPDASVRVSSIEGAVVLDGKVSSATVAEDVREFASQVIGEKGRVINRLSVDAPSQVNLRVRIAEVDRDIEKELGINWEYVGEMFGYDLAVSLINPLSSVVTNSAVLGTPGRDLSAVIRALEEEGLISLLAEPNLTALSGETASFLAGGEFPILVPDDDSITIEFKKFGVSLAFTPTILGESRINLHVRPEVSQLTNEGSISFPVGFNNAVTVPALSVRRAETTVELSSGQSFAIAGLLSNDTAHNVSKVPGLADVPVIGRLFSSDKFKREESELVIIVTPYLVRPTNDRLALPTDGFAPPNDRERIVPSGTWKQSANPGAPTTVRPDGSRVGGTAGFVLE